MVLAGLGELQPASNAFYIFKGKIKITHYKKMADSTLTGNYYLQQKRQCLTLYETKHQMYLRNKNSID